MKYSERVNPDICEKLNMLSFTNFMKLYELSENENGNIDDVKIQFNLLKKYCKLQKDNNYNLEREYKFADNTDKGRLFVKDIGIQRLWNKFRGVLMNDIYYDFDMVNAHPVLLLKICKELKIDKFDLFRLQNYVKYRDDYLNELIDDLNISRFDAKKLILTSMNKNTKIEKYKGKKISSPRFIGLDGEFKYIQTELYRKCKLANSSYNKEGKNLNILLCRLENKVLQLAIDKVKEYGKISVLMFDGFMMETKVKIDKIIKKLNSATKQYGIEWSNKEHNLDILKKLGNDSCGDNVYSFVEDNEVELAKKCNSTFLLDKFVSCQGNLYIKSGLWYSGDKLVKQQLMKTLSKHDLYIDNGTKPLLVSKCIKHLKSLAEAVIMYVNENNQFLENMYYKTKYNIKFNNGHYDVKNKKFVPISEHNMDSFIKIDRDYNNESNEEANNFLYNKILNPIFSVENEESEQAELRDHFLYRMHRSLSGYNEDKIWFSLFGLRDSGKGVLSDLLKNAFQDYVSTTNSDNLLKKAISSDPNKDLNWLVDLRFTRLIITQELLIDDKIEINGTSIKKMCSGGDIVEARKLNANPEKFRLQCSFMMCCNDMPIINPSDTTEKLIPFNMRTVFIDDNYEGTQLNGFFYYKKDNDIKNKLTSNTICNEFVNIILNAKYCPYPKKLNEENKLQREDDDNDQQKLFDMFMFTKDKEDKMTNNDLKFHARQEGINMSLKKMKMLLRCQGVTDFKSNNERGIRGLILRDI